MAITIHQPRSADTRYAVSGGGHAASGLVPFERDSYAGFDVSESMQAMHPSRKHPRKHASSRSVRFEPTQTIEKEMRQMNRLIASVLMATAFTIPAWAASSQAPSVDSSAVDAIKQLGQDMGDAMIALDIEKLDLIFADDWLTIGMPGKVSTKQTLLQGVKSGKKKLVWFELGPMDVQVFGDIAIVQGNVSEKTISDGKETDSKAVYSDILNKRDGRWVVVRSMGATMK
jgi:uncharacterized protein (TIGR02246 family)